MENSTVLCFCGKVTYGRILDSIQAGANSVEAVMEDTTAGTFCGACKAKIASVVEEELAK